MHSVAVGCGGQDRRRGSRGVEGQDPDAALSVEDGTVDEQQRFEDPVRVPGETGRVALGDAVGQQVRLDQVRVGFVEDAVAAGVPAVDGDVESGGSGHLRGGHRGARDGLVAVLLPGGADAHPRCGDVDHRSVVREGGQSVIGFATPAQEHPVTAAGPVGVGEGRDGDHVGMVGRTGAAGIEAFVARRDGVGDAGRHRVGDGGVEAGIAEDAGQAHVHHVDLRRPGGDPVDAGDEGSEKPVAGIVEHLHRPDPCSGRYPHHPGLAVQGTDDPRHVGAVPVTVETARPARSEDRRAIDSLDDVEVGMVVGAGVDDGHVDVGAFRSRRTVGGGRGDGGAGQEVRFDAVVAGGGVLTGDAHHPVGGDGHHVGVAGEGVDGRRRQLGGEPLEGVLVDRPRPATVDPDHLLGQAARGGGPGPQLHDHPLQVGRVVRRCCRHRGGRNEQAETDYEDDRATPHELPLSQRPL